VYKKWSCDTLGGVLNGNLCIILGHVGMLYLQLVLEESKHQNRITEA